MQKGLFSTVYALFWAPFWSLEICIRQEMSRGVGDATDTGLSGFFALDLERDSVVAMTEMCLLCTLGNGSPFWVEPCAFRKTTAHIARDAHEHRADRARPLPPHHPALQVLAFLPSEEPAELD